MVRKLKSLFNAFENERSTKYVNFIPESRRDAHLRPVIIQGKQDDNRWIAQYAATCFIKDALRWFEDLDEEVQNDWRLLRKAMLAKWPAPGGRKSMSSTSRHKSPSPCPSPRSSLGGMSPKNRTPVLPTPSLISSALGISSTAPLNQTPTGSAAKTGRIRVVAEEGGAFGPEGEYVSVRLDGRGHFHITRSVDNALKVQFAPVGGDTQVLKLLNCSSVHESLGMQWGGADAIRLLTAPEPHECVA
ncbi:hypothetical protein FS837_010949 [Tulasnella sp. UAMH 9824]|nr:hypothetical protein FS837_010949 [Tulasnella sp. UAMH 9824]